MTGSIVVTIVVNQTIHNVLRCFLLFAVSLNWVLTGLDSFNNSSLLYISNHYSIFFNLLHNPIMGTAETDLISN